MKKILLFILLVLGSKSEAATKIFENIFENGGIPYTAGSPCIDTLGNYVLTNTGTIQDVNTPPAPQGLFQAYGMGDTNTLTGPAQLGTDIANFSATGWTFATYVNVSATSMTHNMAVYSHDGNHYIAIQTDGSITLNSNSGPVLTTSVGVVNVKTPGYLACSGNSGERNIFYFTGAGPVTTPIAHDTQSFVFTNGSPNFGRYQASAGFDCDVCDLDATTISDGMETSFPVNLNTPTFTSTSTATPTPTITPTPALPVQVVYAPQNQLVFPMQGQLIFSLGYQKIYSNQYGLPLGPISFSTHGASYTWGYPYTDSYRKELISYFQAEGRSVCFVGATVRGTIGCPYTDGINGAKIGDLDMIINTALAADFPTPNSSDYILFGPIEFNDVNGGTSLAAFSASYLSFLGKIKAYSPLIKTYCITGAQPPFPVNISAFVAQEKILEASALAGGQNVRLIDWNSQTNTNWDVDNLHPSQIGYGQMGDYIGQQIDLLQ